MRISKMEREDRAGCRAEFAHMSDAEINEYLARRDDNYYKKLKKEEARVREMAKIQIEKNKRNFGGI